MWRCEEQRECEREQMNLSRAGARARALRAPAYDISALGDWDWVGWAVGRRGATGENESRLKYTYHHAPAGDPARTHAHNARALGRAPA